MKTLIVLMMAFSFSIKVQAQSEESQKAFELEDETIQIHDTEAERESAQQEANHQQQLEQARRAKLEELSAEKARVLARAKGDIAVAEAKRIKAESDLKYEDHEMIKLKQEMVQLKAQAIESDHKAKAAQGLAETGRLELEHLRGQRNDLIRRQQSSERAQVDYTAKAEKMKLDYDRIQRENIQLEAHVKMVEAIAKQKQQVRDQAQRQLASVKARNTAARAQLKAESTAP